jgi:hypothetical protein
MAYWTFSYISRGDRRKKWRYPGVEIPFRLRHRYKA